MTFWRTVDEFVGRAVRRELPPTCSVLLRRFLLFTCLCGPVVALLRPASAAVCLVFPLLVTSFFESVAVGFCLCPIYLWVFAQGPVLLPDTILLGALCVFSVLIGGVTSHKYRLVFAQSRLCAARLETAREVQKTMEPPSFLEFSRLSISTHMEVCHDLGGDFVGIRSLRDGSVLLLMGDVQGKGPQSALTAAYVEGIFHHSCLSGTTQPEEVLERIHHLLAGKGVGRFVTALCLRAEPDGRHFRMANAGHPLPIVHGVSANMVGKTGMVLGLEGMLEIEVTEFQLQQNERILILSDGYYEEEDVSPGLAGCLREAEGVDEILAWFQTGSACERLDDRTMVHIRGIDGSNEAT